MERAPCDVGMNLKIATHPEVKPTSPIEVQFEPQAMSTATCQWARIKRLPPRPPHE